MATHETGEMAFADDDSDSGLSTHEEHEHEHDHDHHGHAQREIEHGIPSSSKDVNDGANSTDLQDDQNTNSTNLKTRPPSRDLGRGVSPSDEADTHRKSNDAADSSDPNAPKKDKYALQDQTNLLPVRQVIVIFMGLNCALFCSLLDQTM